MSHCPVELALPFALLERERDYVIDTIAVPGLREFCEHGFGLSANTDRPSDKFRIRISSQVELDAIDQRSTLIRWDDGTVRPLIVNAIAATDRHVMAGNVVFTGARAARYTRVQSIRITVNRFNWIHEDAADVAVCRDAWLEGQRERAEEIAKKICPHTWPALLAACDIERNVQEEGDPIDTTCHECGGQRTAADPHDGCGWASQARG